MPFIIPLLPAIIAAGAGTAGVIEGAQAGHRQQKALTIQEQIAQQELADKEKVFKQLTDFFSPYLQKGSPFLEMIQRAAAETNAQGANNAAGAVRSEVGRTGFGYGPSGTEAAAIGGVGAEAAKTGSQNYLQNLLANEQVKFNAAQGINAAGSMVGSPQNQPNVSTQLPFQSTGSGLTGLSQVLAGILKNTTNPAPNANPSTIPNLPTGTVDMSTPNIAPGIPSVGGAPTTQGWVM